MMRYILVVIFSAFSLFTLNSCLEETELDSERPEVTVVNPTPYQVFKAGEDVNVNVFFEDNIALFQASVVMVHDSLSWPFLNQNTFDPNLDFYNFFGAVDVNGLQSRGINETVPISDSTLAGYYIFIAQAIDQTGNFTTIDDGSSPMVQAIIQNDFMPRIKVDNRVDGKLGINPGELFVVEGIIADSVPESGEFAGINSISVEIKSCNCEDEETLDDYTSNIQSIDWSEITDSEGSIDLQFIFENKLEFTLTPEKASELIAADNGNLLLIITASDLQGNHAIEPIEVSISN